MGSLRLIVGVLVAACGGAKDVDRAPAPPAPEPRPPVASTDAAAAPVEAPQPKPAAVFDRTKLPEWPIPSVDREAAAAPSIAFAVDADGDRLLLSFGRGFNYVQVATNKRLTGRLSAPTNHHAYAAVGAQLGVDVTHVKPVGKAVTIDFEFVAAPLVDLVNILGDVGKTNIVVGIDAPPAMTVRLKSFPSDGALSVIVERAGLALVAAGPTRYVLAKGATLPALRKLPAVTVDVKAKGATVAQIVTALRGVTALELGSCSTKRVSLLKLKRVPLAEAVRALEVASGETLSDKTACPSRAYANEAVTELKTPVIASAGKKRVVTFEHQGALLVGDKDLAPNDWPAPADADAWLASLKRTAALISPGTRWQALVERTDGFNWIQSGQDRDRFTLIYDVREDGVHVFREGSDVELRFLPLSN